MPCKIQEFRHAPVFNHSCVAKLTIMYQSQNNTSMLITDVNLKLDSTVVHLDRMVWGLFIWKNLIAPDDQMSAYLSTDRI